MNLQNTPTISGGRKYYQGYDILKIILAILIVAAHTRLFIELPEIHYSRHFLQFLHFYL